MVCINCFVIRPINSHHCSICHKCFIEHDHHCPWLSTCIGLNNHKYFIILVFVNLIYFIYNTIILMDLVFSELKKDNISELSKSGVSV